MITIKEALDILQKNAQVLHTEKIPLSISLNRILAEDVIADTDFPPFNKSAVDGYACKKEDLNDTLISQGILRAGDTTDIVINKGQCLKIMTGAPVPEGTDCVIMVEHTTDDGNGNITIVNKSKVNNICAKGEDKEKGQKILSKGSLIRKNHIGVLASAGMHTIEVYQQPNITVFSTGSELVEPEDIPGAGQIRNSNGPQLLTQLSDIGLDSFYGGIAEDDQVMMEIELSRSIENFNGLILSGGVSAGDYDFVPEILKKMGFTIQFHKLKVKPGKPVLFATKGDKFCFGLPGNPVSSYVQFELIVKPYLYALMGHQYKPTILKLKIGEEITRKKSGMESYIPVKFDENQNIVQVSYHGSGHFFALSEAFGLLHFEEEKEGYKKGDWGNVRPL